jgi:hypothetical protein
MMRQRTCEILLFYNALSNLKLVSLSALMARQLSVGHLGTLIRTPYSLLQTEPGTQKSVPLWMFLLLPALLGPRANECLMDR